jgi:conjugal transfer pilus assembly protein TraE
MKLNLFLEKAANLKAENKLLKFSIVVVATGCLLSSYFSYRAIQYQKTVILPPVVDERVVITGTDVNDGYLKMYSKYVMGLMFNYTPHTFADQASDLLKLSTPEFFASLDKKISDMADGIKRLQVTSMFYPHTISVDKVNKIITISGLRISNAQGQEVENTTKHFLIKYKIENGRFYVNGISEKIAA